MRIILVLICGLFSVIVQAQSPEDSPAAGAVSGQGQPITLTTAIGTTLQGYVAGPDDARRGILLLHDRWGLNRVMRARVEQFARRGYRALAIDVFDGRASDEFRLATEIMNATDPEWVKTDVLAGVNYLQVEGRQVAVMGWGYGGWQAFQAGLMASQPVDAIVVGYGDMDMTPEQVRLLRSPVLGVFARYDPNITPEEVDAYRINLRKGFAFYDLQVLDGDHGFADPLYPTYNEALAQRAWDMVDRFLDAHL